MKTILAAALICACVSEGRADDKFRAIGVGRFRYVPLSCKDLERRFDPAFRAQLDGERSGHGPATRRLTSIAAQIVEACQ